MKPYINFLTFNTFDDEKADVSSTVSETLKEHVKC